MSRVLAISLPARLVTPFSSIILPLVHTSEPARKQIQSLSQTRFYNYDLLFSVSAVLLQNELMFYLYILSMDTHHNVL